MAGRVVPFPLSAPPWGAPARLEGAMVPAVSTSAGAWRLELYRFSEGDVSCIVRHAPSRRAWAARDSGALAAVHRLADRIRGLPTVTLGDLHRLVEALEWDGEPRPTA